MVVRSVKMSFHLHWAVTLDSTITVLQCCKKNKGLDANVRHICDCHSHKSFSTVDHLSIYS